MDKEDVAAIAVRGEQIKTNIFCRGIRLLLLPDKPVVTDPAVDPTHLQLHWGGRLRVCNEAMIMKMKHDLAHIDRCFDIDEPTSETSSQSNAQQGPLEYGKRVDALRLAAVSENGGWWNPTTQELIPILPEDDPNYRQNEAIITEAIRRWNGGRSR